MAKDNSSSNREVVAATALAMFFSTEKSQPIVPAQFATKAGTLTFASIRAGLKATEPNLAGNALTERVNELRAASDSVTLAGVLQLNQEGFHFSRFNGRELKNGTRTVSIGMSNATDKKAKPAKKIADYTKAELLELLALREAADKAVVVHEA